MADHYFSASPSGPEKPRTVTARIWGADYALYAAAGVFSGDRLDLGTAVLLRSVDPPVGAARLLDLGCGYGPIAVALARECPEAQVDAVDVNPRAVDLCRRNAQRYGVGDRVHAGRPEAMEPGARYDEIWSNPPIRIGKAALHALLLTWLARLTADGVARLVVGRNLGADSLQDWLTGEGWPTERVASAKGFRVLEVRRSSR